VAGSRRPSFLKRQKEQKRRARATEKRETRLARKRAQAAGEVDPGSLADPAGLIDSPELADSGVPTEPDEQKPDDGAQPNE
jgi:hypothetical protein